MIEIAAWGAASLFGLYLAAHLFSAVSKAIARALLNGMRKTLSRESRTLVSIQQEAAHYQRLLTELAEADLSPSVGIPLFRETRSVVG